MPNLLFGIIVNLSPPGNVNCYATLLALSIGVTVGAFA